MNVAYINIQDLMDTRRLGDGVKVRKFPSEVALRAYTKWEDKIVSIGIVRQDRHASAFLKEINGKRTGPGQYCEHL